MARSRRDIEIEFNEVYLRWKEAKRQSADKSKIEFTQLERYCANRAVERFPDIESREASGAREECDALFNRMRELSSEAAATQIP